VFPHAFEGKRIVFLSVFNTLALQDHTSMHHRCVRPGPLLLVVKGRGEAATMNWDSLGQSRSHQCSAQLDSGGQTIECLSKYAPKKRGNPLHNGGAFYIETLLKAKRLPLSHTFVSTCHRSGGARRMTVNSSTCTRFLTDPTSTSSEVLQQQ